MTTKRILAPEKRQTVQVIDEELAWLIEAAKSVENQEFSARSIARLAVHAGLMLIGTTETADKHYPVEAAEHSYFDLRDGQKTKYSAEPGTKLLQVGTNADIAIMCGLFGDINSAQQRTERCAPITGKTSKNFGWGTDVYKTFARGLFDNEEAHVRTHARPELIHRALDTENPLTGYIDCVYDDPSLTRIPHEIGQHLSTEIRTTVFRIPLVSCIDLPLDILPTRYVDTSSMALTPPTQ